MFAFLLLSSADVHVRPSLDLFIFYLCQETNFNHPGRVGNKRTALSSSPAWPALDALLSF